MIDIFVVGCVVLTAAAGWGWIFGYWTGYRTGRRDALRQMNSVLDENVFGGSREFLDPDIDNNNRIENYE